MLAAELPRLESTEGLVRAAIAISLHAFDDVVPQRIERRLQSYANRVLRRVRGPQIQAKLAHLHEVLFEEEGFYGNAVDYYSPLNSFLPVVLESRRGIPITLCLIYKAVAEKVGIPVVGLNLPGHFLVEVIDPHERLIVDPFLGGMTLSEADLHLRHAQYLPYLGSGQTWPVASHKQWISRMIANLQHIFTAFDRTDDLAAMSELQDLVSAMPR